jgi:quercetin dioxygenase-like cupin family protein
MGKRIAVAAGVLFVIGAFHIVSAQTKPASVTTAEAVKYVPLDPKDPNGLNVSVVTGQLQGKGPVSFFMRQPKGPAPEHTHSFNYTGVVVKGQTKHWPAGAQAKAQVLNPGSTWFQPAKLPHGDECLTDGGCLIFLQFEGPFDFAVAAAR